MLRDRLLSALFGLAIFFAVIFSEVIVINVAVIVLILLALLEAYDAFGYLKTRPLSGVSLLVPLFILFGRLANRSRFVFALYAYLLLLFLLLIIYQKEIRLKDISLMFTITVVISLFFWHIVLVRQMPDGIYYIWTIFIGAWLTDTFAYFAGSLLGKHKLAPSLSPKKTVEGAVGGWVGCMLGMAVFGGILAQIAPGRTIDWGALLFLGALCGIVSQVGDLAASAMKREYGIKDFGNIMPGHGGVLDRFDSIMFIAPLVYYFLSIFPILK